MSDLLVVDPKPVVAGLLPNNPPLPKAVGVLVFALDWPNSPVADVGGAVALLAVDPKVPPLPNVEVLPPPPNAPKPVAGFAPPNSEPALFVLALLFALAKAPAGTNS